MFQDMQIFNYNGFADIRTISIDNGPWWVLRDVCVALGISNHKMAGKRLDPDGVSLADLPDVFGQIHKTTIINEPALYELVLRSDKPSAKDFKRWITHEVIPSIRKTGSYAVQPQPMSPAQLIAAQAQLMVDMEQKMSALQDQTNTIQNQYTQLSQKVDTAVKAFSRPSDDHWKADMDRAIKDLCEERHLSEFATRGRMYRDLEQKINCDITSRLTRLRNRKKKAGARRKDVMALSKLDAIAADKQLRAAFELVVKEWQARSFILEGQREIVEQEEFEIVD